MKTPRIRDVMTPQPFALPSSAPLHDAAFAMAEFDIGDVLVTDNGRVRGIVTDRDLVVRSLAAGRDPGRMTLADVCSDDKVVTVQAEEPADSAAQLMREHAVRRVPVVDGEEIVGIVTLGDLARVGAARDTAQLALAGVSAAEPNN